MTILHIAFLPRFYIYLFIVVAWACVGNTRSVYRVPIIKYSSQLAKYRHVILTILIVLE